MERGQLGIENRQATVFVFDGLVAKIQRPRTERMALRLHQWETALSAWEFDLQVCDYMNALMSRYSVPIDVITWRPKGFADALLDRLWDLDVTVRRVRTGTYQALSQHIAIDNEVSVVFDADPAHRSGYGWKCREWMTGVV